MYQEIVPIEEQKSLRKKPRLTISEVPFIALKTKIAKKPVKPENKSKFSQINLKGALLIGFNHQSPRQKRTQRDSSSPEHQYELSKYGRSHSFGNLVGSQALQNFIAKERQNELNQKLKTKPSNFSSNKTKQNAFFPTIISNTLTSETRCQQKQQQKPDQNTKQPDFKHLIRLQLEQVAKNSNQQQKFTLFKKLKSQSLTHMQNKVRYNKTRQSNKNENANNCECVGAKQQCCKEAGQKSAKLGETTTADFHSQLIRRRKFSINNINLDTPQNHTQAMNKRKYILKFLQRNELVLVNNKRQNRKNTHLLKGQQEDRILLKLNQQKSYENSNLISRRIVLANPEEMLLRRMEATGGRKEGGKERRGEQEGEGKVGEGKVGVVRENRGIVRNGPIDGWEVGMEDGGFGDDVGENDSGVLV